MSHERQIRFIREQLKDGWSLCNMLLPRIEDARPVRLFTVDGEIPLPSIEPQYGGLAPLLQYADIVNILRANLPDDGSMIIFEDYLERASEIGTNAGGACFIFYGKECYTYASLNDSSAVKDAVYESIAFRHVGIMVDGDALAFSDRCEVDETFMKTLAASARFLILSAHDGEALMIVSLESGTRSTLSA